MARDFNSSSSRSGANSGSKGSRFVQDSGTEKSRTSRSISRPYTWQKNTIDQPNTRQMSFQPKLNSSELSPGILIDGRYRIIEAVARGAMGWVYRALHVYIKRITALKVLDVDQPILNTPEYRERFRHEAEVSAIINHPNVIRIHDYGFFGPREIPYIAMQFLEGHDLQEELEKGAVPRPRVVRFIDQALSALVVSHAQNIIHKDLKPANLFVQKPGTLRERLIVLDFGVARMQTEDSSAGMTRVGELAGTPEYLPPEYIKQQIVTPALDVYSMGLVMIELLLGRSLVSGRTPMERLLFHLQGPIQIPEPLASSCIAPVLRKSLSPDPEQRYQNAAELLAALRKVEVHFLNEGSTIQRSFSPPLVDYGRSVSGSENASTAELSEEVKWTDTSNELGVQEDLSAEKTRKRGALREAEKRKKAEAKVREAKRRQKESSDAVQNNFSRREQSKIERLRVEAKQHSTQKSQKVLSPSTREAQEGLRAVEQQVKKIVISKGGTHKGPPVNVGSAPQNIEEQSNARWFSKDERSTDSKFPSKDKSDLTSRRANTPLAKSTAPRSAVPLDRSVNLSTGEGPSIVDVSLGQNKKPSSKISTSLSGSRRAFRATPDVVKRGVGSSRKSSRTPAKGTPGVGAQQGSFKRVRSGLRSAPPPQVSRKTGAPRRFSERDEFKKIFHRAVAAAREHKYDTAIRLFEKCATIRPNHHSVKHNIKALRRRLSGET